MRPRFTVLSRTLTTAIPALLAGASCLLPMSAAAGGPGSRSLTVNERLAFQRAIEEVYWRHRIWPEQNPGPKPALSEVLSESILRQRAEDGPRLSTALRTLWNVPVDGPQLAREIQRMISSTRSPAMLDELFEALGRDPLVIAECLARPRLASRLAQQRYAYDPRFHGAVAERAQAARSTMQTPADLKAGAEAYREVVWRRGDPETLAGPVVSSVHELVLTPEEWSERVDRLTVPIDQRTPLATFPVGHITPVVEDDDAFRSMAVLESREGWLRLGIGEWRKEPFQSWWGRARETWVPADTADIGSLAVPQLPRTVCTNDTWTPIGRRLPGARTGHTAVWTGAEMIVWGGGAADGERYDPITDTWTALPTAGAPMSTNGNTAVWTGQEMVIWGGTGQGVYFDSGARYNPSLDAWIPVAPLLDYSPGPITATWTGSRMLVFGVVGYVGGEVENYGWSYDPVANSWQPISLVNAPTAPVEYTAVWANGVLVVWGTGNGGRYNPGTNTWQAISSDGAPTISYKHTAVWTGAEMLVWGPGDAYVARGGRYAPATDTWAPMSTQGAPSGCLGHSAVWAGQEMIVFQGYPFGQGAIGGRYNPTNNTWTSVAESGAPLWRQDHSAVWTGSEMVVFGGAQVGSPLRSGGRYNPVADTWAPSAVAHQPTLDYSAETVWTGAEAIVAGEVPGRYDPATDTWTPLSTQDSFPERQPAIWTGLEVIAWGGQNGARGSRYNPTSDAWTGVSHLAEPLARQGHRLVWTGTEMIVWGGTCCDFYVSLNDGGRYSPSTNTWKGIPSDAAPIGRSVHAQAWTGSRMIVWGGYSQAVPSTAVTNTGGVYDPATSSWSLLPTDGAPSARRPEAWAWTGHELLVWGGYDGSSLVNSGGLYDPVAGTWSSTSTANAPPAAAAPTCDWTGTELLVWGGDAVSSGRYDAALDTWVPMSVTGAPDPRSRVCHTFAGTQLFVWGSNETLDGGLYCAPPPPRLEARPAVVSFGRIAYGDTASIPVSITNRGGEYLVLGALTSPALPFAVTSDPCSGQTLPHGLSCTLMTTFSPVSTGSFSSVVNVASNDPETSVATVWLAGEGVNTLLEPVQVALADADSNGVAEPGEVVSLAPSWKNVGPRLAADVTGALAASGGATILDAAAAYGTIAAGATASCGTDGYQLQVATSRPALHWDLELGETLSTGEAHTWTLHVGDSFADVPRSHWAYRFVETIFHNHVTSGCNSNPFRYCPGTALTRAEMAVLLLMAEHGPDYTPPPATGTVFTDVPRLHWAGDYIEQLATEGITSGCDVGKYCPDNPITRAEMAVFLLVAEHSSAYVPPLSSGTVFTDVPIDHWAGDFIEQLAAEGITSGCATDLYCPNGVVTRAEMAVFLTATFGLVLNH